MANKRVALIQSFNSNKVVLRVGSTSPGLLGLVALLKQNDCPVIFLDAYLEDFTDDMLAERLREFGPDVIGVSCVSENRFDAIKTIKRLRAEFPEALIMSGGCQFSYYSEQALSLMPELDLIIRGEGEEPMMALMQADFDAGELGGIMGLTWRTPDGRIVSNPDTAHLGELDDYPDPDWQEAPLHAVTGFSPVTARGCVGHCIFCSGAKRRMRFRSPERVLDEIQTILDLVGHERLSGHLGFADDTLTQNPAHCADILDGMINRGFNLRWSLRSRADAITEDLVKHLKAAGCYHIGTGVDAPSQSIMDSMGKRESIEDIERAFTLYSKHKLNSAGSILLGYEGETREDHKAAVRLMKKLNKLPHVNIGMGLLMIYPGTVLEQQARENGSLPPDFSWYRKKDMGEVERGLSVSFQSVPYFRPSTISYRKLKWFQFRHTKLSAHYLKHALRYIITRRRWDIFFSKQVYRVFFARFFEPLKPRGQKDKPGGDDNVIH